MHGYGLCRGLLAQPGSVCVRPGSTPQPCSTSSVGSGCRNVPLMASKGHPGNNFRKQQEEEVQKNVTRMTLKGRPANKIFEIIWALRKQQEQEVQVISNKLLPGWLRTAVRVIFF